MTLNEKGLHACPVIAWFFFYVSFCSFFALSLSSSWLSPLSCLSISKKSVRTKNQITSLYTMFPVVLDWFQIPQMRKKIIEPMSKCLSQPLHYALLLRWSRSRINISFNLLRSRNKKRVIVTNFASSCISVIVVAAAAASVQLQLHCVC